MKMQGCRWGDDQPEYDRLQVSHVYWLQAMSVSSSGTDTRRADSRHVSGELLDAAAQAAAASVRLAVSTPGTPMRSSVDGAQRIRMQAVLKDTLERVASVASSAGSASSRPSGENFGRISG